MRIDYCKQLSPEWWQLHTGRIGGRRFGQVISGRKNRLVYDLLNEVLDGMPEMDEFESDDMLFGRDNEPVARKLYSEMSGIEFIEVGSILSEESGIHMASPDGLNIEKGIVLEIKCTQNGSIHLQRFFEGPEASYMPQIINYFAVSDDVTEVHWISYCPYRPERPIVVCKYLRWEFEKEISTGRNKINQIETDLKALKNQFEF